jgi:hypothetical protein
MGRHGFGKNIGSTAMKRHTLLAVVLTVAGWQFALCETQKSGWPEETWGSPFGSPFRGLAISVKPTKAEYKLGEQVEVWVRFKNTGDQRVTLRVDRHEPAYRVALFYSDGTPVPQSEEVKRTEERIGKPSFGPTSTTFDDLAAGEAPLFFRPIRLNMLFRIDKPGTYLVVVMHKLESWKDGFAISNLAKFEVTAREDKMHPDAQPNEARRHDGK